MSLHSHDSMFLLVSFVVVVALCFGCTGDKSTRSGVGDRRLAGCPDAPNCVSTESQVKSHAIAPLLFRSPPDKAFGCLRETLAKMDRVRILVADQDYIHAEFRTVLGFVDDAEFHLDRKNRVIRMRSASRIGYWDFGVNRRRLEGIRSRFKLECG
jgi:uncharacterized protein (DUF1499 family)